MLSLQKLIDIRKPDEHYISPYEHSGYEYLKYGKVFVVTRGMFYFYSTSEVWFGVPGVMEPRWWWPGSWFRNAEEELLRKVDRINKND